MTTPAVNIASVSVIQGYQLRLPIFEGPLDVLLRLIERNQLEITDVSLVEVTDQFLSYVASISETSPGILAEFTQIASRLLLLKSRSLLPSTNTDDGEEPERDDLTQQLLAYKAVRDAALMLEERQKQGLHAYQRPPNTEDWGQATESLLPMPAASLVNALKRCVRRHAPEPDSLRPRPVISLADMTRRIVDRLRSGGRTRFTALLSGKPDRHEYVAGFVALLTLWKQRSIEVSQQEHFGEIEVEPARLQEQAADD